MRDQYKLLQEKYQGILEQTGKPVMKQYANGDKEWYLKGELHRVDGPARERADGSKEWFLNDKRHRVDGPAVEYADGYKVWYLNDELHRVDGPAVERADGSKAWWLNNKEYTEEEFLKWKWKQDQHNILKKASDETGIEMDI